MVADLAVDRAARLAEDLDGLPVEVDVADAASAESAVATAAEPGPLRIAVERRGRPPTAPCGCRRRDGSAIHQKG